MPKLRRQIDRGDAEPRSWLPGLSPQKFSELVRDVADELGMAG
ncbi:MAG TPA: hypothetical protein VGJ02_09360 [Pyrinomonadaceae bacterium]